MFIGPALTGSQRLSLEVVTVFVLIGIIIIGYFLSTFIMGAGYEPIPRKILDRMIELSGPTKDRRVYDLGSGFGRIILRVAQVTGATCTGVEVDPLKVWWTRRVIRSKGLQGQVDVVKSNLLTADISKADFVYAFLWDGIMQKLGDKAIKEMKPGSMIVSYYHKILGWEPEKQDTKSKIYLYKIPEKSLESL
ncbi:MAG: class I SAM-dependent methyltransferase [Thaumarchaeota archaeon]|nr:class I SAM-dependent methyltransferase [Nitrososphaerota archaeon]